MTAETIARKQRGRPFLKGRSGNPEGRPRGARNAATVIAEELLDGEAAIITRKAIDLAKEGNPVALRLCLDRLLPPRRDRPVAFPLPPLKSTADAVAAQAAIVAAVADGNLTPAEAAELSSLIGNVVRAIEATELEQRVRALEEQAGTTQ
jgi:hypothetical protein